MFPLGPIQRTAFSQFITERFASTSVHITESAIARVLDITDGHPHDMQKLGYFTWAEVDGEQTEATVETVERALATAIAADTARYTELWDGLTTNQRRLLEAIGRAAPTEEILSEDFRRRARLGAYATTERAPHSLLQRGLVEREGRGHAVVPDVFLRQWLRMPASLQTGGI